MFQAYQDRNHGWRIILTINGADTDVCGAVDGNVAWAQAEILNRMRDLPAKAKEFWKRK